MKQIYFFIFFFVGVVSSAQQGFQIELVDDNVGYSLTQAGVYSDESNDDGLNQIFQNHNVLHYEGMFGYSIPSMVLKLGYVVCDNCNSQQFIDDLMNYNSVIKSASIYIYEDFIVNNGLSLTLTDENVGIFISESNDLVTTNDTGLNQIFSDFSVRVYENTNIGTSYEHYELVCNCDKELLKQELDNYNSVITSTDFIYATFLLSVEEQSIENIKIYPNPFKDKIIININIQLKEILLYDILGKQVYKSNNTQDFENFSSSLISGIYILKLIDQSDRSITRKLVKN